jgi:hypothetical protein
MVSINVVNADENVMDGRKKEGGIGDYFIWLR